MSGTPTPPGPVRDGPDATRAALPGLVPEWAAPAGVGAFSTVRAGGVSAGPFGLVDGAPGGLNLGDHVGDDPAAVARNRARLERALPAPVRWLAQVHGTAVHDADAHPACTEPPVADAAVTTRTDVVLAVMTADCLPILLADARGRMVGVAHGGWRGLAAGVAEAAVDAMRARLGDDARIVAWLGPAIGPRTFEVGDEVKAAFVADDAGAASAFAPGPAAGKWWADLAALARRRLARRAVTDVAGGTWCTATDAVRFYSHRRDRRSGRLASLVWRRG